MKYTYRKELNRTELLIREEEAPRNAYEVQMFFRCRIRGLAPCTLIRINHELVYAYRVTSLIPLSELCRKGTLTSKMLVAILKGILASIRELEDYLLLPEHLILLPDCIFYDPSKERTLLLFFPSYSVPVLTSLRTLMETLFPLIPRHDTPMILSCYRFYRALLDPEVHLTSLLRLLARELGDPEEEPKEIELVAEQKEELPAPSAKHKRSRFRFSLPSKRKPQDMI